MDFLEELDSAILPADGAMGTQLLETGIPPESCLEELCIGNPELVRDIHERYIAAGARLIETNSFGANGARLEKHRLEAKVNEINWTAAQLAKQAAKGKNVFVAGSVGPLGAPGGRVNRKELFQEQMGALLDGGVDLILLETFTDLEEMLVALDVKLSLHHCPVICSFACTDEGMLASGMPVRDAFAVLRERGADLLGLNCINGPDAMLALIEHLSGAGVLSAFPNAGLPEKREGRLLYGTTPERFAAAGVALAGRGARLIGGCCGIGPAHIAALAEALRGMAPAVPRPSANPISQ